MSRFLEYNEEEDKYIETIECYKACKWRINDICCNEKSDYLGNWDCDAENKEDELCFEEEDGIIEDE